MVTRPSEKRTAFATRSIAAYCSQTYPYKELVIVQDDGDPTFKHDLSAFVVELKRNDIRLVDAPPDLTLGALRNFSRAHAGGTVICQWDDDDLHHAERVEQQLAALQKSDRLAVGLQEALQYFPQSRELFWTSWRNTPAKILPGTIMFRVDAPISYPEAGPEAQRGEDSNVCQQLLAQDALSPLGGAPHLYIYVSHGANTWGDDHHAMLAKTLGISNGLLHRRERWLREKLAAIDFGPGPIAVRSHSGTAFTIDC